MLAFRVAFDVSARVASRHSIRSCLGSTAIKTSALFETHGGEHVDTHALASQSSPSDIPSARNVYAYTLAYK